VFTALEKPLLLNDILNDILNDTRLVHGIFVSDVAFSPLSALHIAFFFVPVGVGGLDVTMRL
jgi:hypothetical protein